jgi:hypothetical protein
MFPISNDTSNMRPLAWGMVGMADLAAAKKQKIMPTSAVPPPVVNIDPAQLTPTQLKQAQNVINQINKLASQGKAAQAQALADKLAKSIQTTMAKNAKQAQQKIAQATKKATQQQVVLQRKADQQAKVAERKEVQAEKKATQQAKVADQKTAAEKQKVLNQIKAEINQVKAARAKLAAALKAGVQVDSALVAAYDTYSACLARRLTDIGIKCEALTVAPKDIASVINKAKTDAKKAAAEAKKKKVVTEVASAKPKLQLELDNLKKVRDALKVCRALPKGSKARNECVLKAETLAKAVTGGSVQGGGVMQMRGLGLAPMQRRPGMTRGKWNRPSRMTPRSAFAPQGVARMPLQSAMADLGEEIMGDGSIDPYLLTDMNTGTVTNSVLQNQVAAQPTITTSPLPPMSKTCTKNPEKPQCMVYKMAFESQELLKGLIAQIIQMQGEILALMSELRSGGGMTQQPCYDPNTGAEIACTSGITQQPCFDPNTGAQIACGSQYDPNYYPNQGGVVAPIPSGYDPSGGWTDGGDMSILPEYPTGPSYVQSGGVSPGGVSTASIPDGFDVGGGGDFIPSEDISVGGGMVESFSQQPAIAMRQQPGAAVEPYYPIEQTSAMLPAGAIDAGGMFDESEFVPQYQQAQYQPQQYQPQQYQPQQPTYQPTQYESFDAPVDGALTESEFTPEALPVPVQYTEPEQGMEQQQVLEETISVDDELGTEW